MTGTTKLKNNIEKRQIQVFHLALIRVINIYNVWFQLSGHSCGSFSWLQDESFSMSFFNDILLFKVFTLKNWSLTTGGAGSTTLPAASSSITVTVAVETGPSRAFSGPVGPRMMEKVSCHSMSPLYKISTWMSMDWTATDKRKQNKRRELDAAYKYGFHGDVDKHPDDGY